MTEHEQYGDLAGAYAFGALDAADRAAFERHLSACAECRQLVADARLLADALPHTLTPVDPPAALRHRIMMAAAPAAAATPFRWFAIAGALLAAISGTVAWTQYRQVTTSQAAAAQSQGQLEARQAIDILAADDVSRVELKGQPAAPVGAERGLLFARGVLKGPVLRGRIHVDERALVFDGDVEPSRRMRGKHGLRTHARVSAT